MKLAVIALGGLMLLGADAASFGVEGARPVAIRAHGAAASVRIDPGAPTMPVFDPGFAVRAGFRPGPFGTAAKVGTVQVNGRSAVIRLDLGGGEYKRRVTWFTAPFLDGVDGLLGPGGVPAERVRFDLRSASPGERPTVLPLVDFGYSGMGVRVVAAGAPIDVLFTLRRAPSLATAAAGAAIAGDQGGKFDAAPEQMPIVLQVVRPVRHLALDRPLRVGPLVLTGLMVRTADFGSTAAIPDADAPPPDPDEIVVVGDKKAKKQRRKLEIGADDLAGCSSILFDKRAKTVTLSCR